MIEKTPSAEFSSKLIKAAEIIGNWSNGSKYSAEILNDAFCIIETAKAIGYEIPSSNG